MSETRTPQQHIRTGVILGMARALNMIDYMLEDKREECARMAAGGEWHELTHTAQMGRAIESARRNLKRAYAKLQRTSAEDMHREVLEALAPEEFDALYHEEGAE